MAESVYSGNPAVTHRRWDERQGGVKVEMTIITRANHTWIGSAATRLQSQFAASL
jgi:poly(3-hydroxybutyrate) depolymerase